MRTSLIALILMVFTTNDCTKPDQVPVTSMSYETFTRGSSTIYRISPDSLKIISSGLNSSQNSIAITKAQWDVLLEKLQGVEVSKINQLKADSEERARDAAAHAILSVRKNDTIYKTNTFDHGNAPEPIQPLVEAILRLAENVE
ncbi:hypothetical protein [Gramella sp. KN1008]|uniref:hypothetical protein n=1 Tax=Gramella sp. KN1008 TaxID=2529298 RepID=UPI00103C2E98|nr:hypothetical protein [Gramella sp. KN1008]TBW27881.1 hypothetical protein EZJ28_09080 [Gramella sp. KN1008]